MVSSAFFAPCLRSASRRITLTTRRRLSLMDGFGLGFDSRHFHSIRLSFHLRLTRGKPPRLFRTIDSFRESSVPSKVEGLLQTQRGARWRRVVFYLLLYVFCIHD